MGQIIDFEQWRSRNGAAVRVEADKWVSSAQAADLMTSSIGMWRSAMAAWAGLWLAPYGLLVSPVQPSERPAKSQRAACDPRG